MAGACLVAVELVDLLELGALDRDQLRNAVLERNLRGSALGRRASRGASESTSKHRVHFCEFG